MKLPALLLALFFSEQTQVADPYAGKIRVLENQDRGYIYLIPGKPENCPAGFGDAYADDLVNQETQHGCYRVDHGDVIIITDNNQGIAIPLELFVPMDGS